MNKLSGYDDCTASYMCDDSMGLICNNGTCLCSDSKKFFSGTKCGNWKKENKLLNLVIEFFLLIEPKKLYNEKCSMFDLCNDVLDLKCENYVCKCYSDKYYDVKSSKCSKLKLTFWKKKSY